MNLKEKFYDRLGFKRESTINSMKANTELKEGNIVLVAETGYYYDVVKAETEISLQNNLFAKEKENVFLKWIKDHISKLSSQTEDGHMSKEDKKKLDELEKVTINSDTEAVENTIASRDGSANLKANAFKCNIGDESRITGAMAFRVSTSDNVVRFCSDKTAIKNWLGIKELQTKILWEGSVYCGGSTAIRPVRISIASTESFANYDYVEFHFGNGRIQVLRYKDGTVSGNIKENRNVIISSEFYDQNDGFSSYRIGFYNNKEVVYFFHNNIGTNHPKSTPLTKIVGYRLG
ncbi:MAG: hypothetical protein ACRC51_03995 [Cetobacterium sp.]